MVEYSIVSSAYSPILDCMDDGKSLMYHKNSKGARIVPWGTPELTGCNSLVNPSKTTRCCLLIKNFVSMIGSSF